MKLEESTHISEGKTLIVLQQDCFLFIDTFLSAAEHFGAFCALH